MHYTTYVLRLQYFPYVFWTTKIPPLQNTEVRLSYINLFISLFYQDKFFLSIEVIIPPAIIFWMMNNGFGVIQQ